VNYGIVVYQSINHFVLEKSTELLMDSKFIWITSAYILYSKAYYFVQNKMSIYLRLFVN